MLGRSSGNDAIALAAASTIGALACRSLSKAPQQVLYEGIWRYMKVYEGI